MCFFGFVCVAIRSVSDMFVVWSLGGYTEFNMIPATLLIALIISFGIMTALVFSRTMKNIFETKISLLSTITIKKEEFSKEGALINNFELNIMAFGLSVLSISILTNAMTAIFYKLLNFAAPSGFELNLVIVTMVTFGHYYWQHSAKQALQKEKPGNSK